MVLLKLIVHFVCKKYFNSIMKYRENVVLCSDDICFQLSEQGMIDFSICMKLLSHKRIVYTSS